MALPYALNPMGINGNSLSIPLTFEALENNSSVTLNAIGSVDFTGIKYRLGKSGNWLSYTPGNAITLANGERVQMFNTNETFSLSSLAYFQFAMTGKIKASGNIQSLLNFLDDSVNQCFYSLFRNCTSLIEAPKMPAKSIKYMSYNSMYRGCSSLVNVPDLAVNSVATYGCVSMFYDCTSLVKAPSLFTTTLAPYCYNDMFHSCNSLTTPPILPATTLRNYCYYNMFQGCTSLIQAPELPATTLVSNCYRQMFYKCTSLSSIQVNFNDWNAEETATADWLKDVSSTGTFTKPSALEEVRGGSRIPTGWTIINK